VNQQETSVIERLKSSLGAKISDVYEDGRGVVVRVDPGSIPDVLQALRADASTPFDLLADVTAVDWSRWSEQTGAAESPPAARFSLYYNLYSIAAATRLFVEAWLEDGQDAPSATPFYASADWAERTVYDMFGIRFSGHPDLRRIYMPEGFEYSPLRKEFPRRGIDPQDFPQE
jgi:NADH-quinone oxidoreductase subunit C